MAWVAVRAIGTPRGARRGPGVTPTLYAEMSLLRNTLLQNMREEAPVNKNPSAKNRGALRNSLRAGPWLTNGRIWRTEFSALEYIKYVIHDTKPHRIEAKPGKVLAISGPIGVSSSLKPLTYSSLGGIAGKLGRKGGPSIMAAPRGYSQLRGDVTFLMFVNHPGTKANDFVSRAYKKTMATNLPGFSRSLKSAIEGDLISLAVPA